MNERKKPSSPELAAVGGRPESGEPRRQSSPDLPAIGDKRRASSPDLPAIGERRRGSSPDLPAIGERRRPSSPELQAVGSRSDAERTSTPRVPRILLVDDSPAILSFVKAYLVRLDCEFVEAADAHRAIRLASLMLVDLIIADINMPGMSGIEMVHVMRNGDNPRLRKIPIVLMTADKSPELERLASEAGTSEFVLKPVDGKLLAQSVERLLRDAT